MDSQTIFFGIILHRFFKRFQNITYHGVSISHFFYFHVLNFMNDYYGMNWAEENLPYWQEELKQLNDSEIYDWSDGPYTYDPHPDGIVLMRAGFGDIASLYLPKERYFLISPHQAEVDTIKLNRPDLIAHSITDYYRENPKAVARLTEEITQTIKDQTDDSLWQSPKLLKWFKDQIPGIVYLLDAVQSLFETFQISAVISISSTYSMDGALNLIARANRIPSFTLQHGLIADHELFCHVPILATRKLIWGKATLAWYQKFGYPESRVSVIGSPRFDIIFKQQWWSKNKLCQTLGIEPGKKIIVYAAQIIRFNQTIAPIVFEALKSIPELFLLMLLHPGEEPALYEHLTGGFTNSKIIRFGQIGLYNALSGADYFITYYSTAALEAMFFKLPVITIEPTPPTFSFGDQGASIKVTDAEELHQVVNRLIHDEIFRINAINHYQKFLSEYCIPDGFAGKRLFDLVESLCRTGGIA